MLLSVDLEDLEKTYEEKNLDQTSCCAGGRSARLQQSHGHPTQGKSDRMPRCWMIRLDFLPQCGHPQSCTPGVGAQLRTALVEALATATEQGAVNKDVVENRAEGIVGDVIYVNEAVLISRTVDAQVPRSARGHPHWIVDICEIFCWLKNGSASAILSSVGNCGEIVADVDRSIVGEHRRFMSGTASLQICDHNLRRETESKVMLEEESGIAYGYLRWVDPHELLKDGRKRAAVPALRFVPSKNCFFRFRSGQWRKAKWIRIDSADALVSEVDLRWEESVSTPSAGGEGDAGRPTSF